MSDRVDVRRATLLERGVLRRSLSRTAHPPWVPKGTHQRVTVQRVCRHVSVERRGSAADTSRKCGDATVLQGTRRALGLADDAGHLGVPTGRRSTAGGALRPGPESWSSAALIRSRGAAILDGVATLNLTLNLNLKLSVRQTPTTSSDRAPLSTALAADQAESVTVYSGGDVIS